MDLNPAQRAAVESEAAPLCILAGAGSGKTRVLTHRIAHRIRTGQADAAHVLALTFTRKAAGELRSRLDRLGVRSQVAAGTFHAIAYAQLRRRWAEQGQAAPGLLDRKARLLVPLLSRRRPADARGGLVQPADVAGEIEWAKARMVDPAGYEKAAETAGRTPPLPFAELAAVYRRYEDEKRRRGLVDFDDLLGLCAAAMATDATFAASQRWRFRHLFVDEFQDVNLVQYRLLEGWLGDRLDLCVVGDPNQAIYSWNGADFTYLTEFGRRFPTAEVVRLVDNYRSTPQVLTVANAVLLAGGVTGADLRAGRGAGPVPTVGSYESDVAEARGVAARVRRAHRPGVRWSDIAVLTRTNAQGLLFEEALRAAGVPYRVRGDGAFLDQPEVRQALDALRRQRGGGSDALRSWRADLHAATVEASAGTDERRRHLDGLVRLVDEYVALDRDATAAGFVAWAAASVRSESAEAGDAVEICTFHRAKGLEWRVVFVTGLERGLVPIGHATSPEAEAEERRLLYVAVTRAEDELHCSWAQRRVFARRPVPRSPSPYLEAVEVAVEVLKGSGAADAAAVSARLAGARRQLDRARRRTAGTRGPATADSPLLTALKAWRMETARAAKVPAYVIFHDTTLMKVAEAAPRTRDELLALPGLGPVKADRYGEALLAVVQRHQAAAS